MLNRVILQGRLCADPELRKTTSGMAVTSFRIACNDSRKGPNGEEVTLFMNCTMFGTRGESFAKLFRKGSMAIVEGRLTSRKYTNRAGQEVTTFEINAENFEFCDSKSANGAQPSGYTSDAPASAPMSQVQASSGNLDSIDVVDDDLPF